MVLVFMVSVNDTLIDLAEIAVNALTNQCEVLTLPKLEMLSKNINIIMKIVDEINSIILNLILRDLKHDFGLVSKMVINIKSLHTQYRVYSLKPMKYSRKKKETPYKRGFFIEC